MFNLYTRLIVKPLRNLYLYGPSWIGWQGLSSSQICASVTQFSELFWLDHDQECQELITNKFEAYKISLESSLHFMCLFFLLRELYLILCVCRKKHHLNQTNYSPPIYVGIPSTSASVFWPSIPGVPPATTTLQTKITTPYNSN